MEAVLSNHKTAVFFVFFFLTMKNILVSCVCFRWQRHFQRVFPPARQCHSGTSLQHGHPKHVCGQMCGHVHREGEGSFFGGMCVLIHCTYVRVCPQCLMAVVL